MTPGDGHPEHLSRFDGRPIVRRETWNEDAQAVEEAWYEDAETGEFVAYAERTS